MKKAIVFLGALATFMFVVCALLPAQFSFKRTIIIEKNKEVPFSLIASFRNWQYWSAWSNSNLQITYRGPETHVGAEMIWQRTENNGGYNKIVEFKPYDYIKVETFLNQFSKPIFMEFSFKENSSKSCELTWTQSGNLSFFERPFGLFMERFMSKDIELGLVNLKMAAEKQSQN